ncbi:MAG: membrane protein insertase YidC [Pseudomonadota bacterium]
MDYKKIVLYALFIVVALTLWTKWQQEYLRHGSSTTTSTSTQQVDHTNKTAKTATTTSAPSGASNTSASESGSVASVTNTPTKDRLIHIKTDVLDMTIDSLGGRIVEADLPKYPVALHSDQAFKLLSYDAASHYSATAALIGFTDHAIQYHTANQSYTLAKGQKHLNVVLQGTSANGLQISKVFTFTPGSYLVHVSYHIRNASTKAQQGRLSLQISRTDVKPSRDGTFRMHAFYGFAISTPANHYQTFKFSNLASSNVNLSAKDGWLAMTQHYFLGAWIPASGVTYDYFSRVNQNGIYTLGANSPTTTIAPGKTVNLNSEFYIGPKIAEILSSVAPNLSKTIDYGWLWPISLLIFWLMKHIFAIIGNWGWSIVIVTAIIKLIFWPLSAKSYRSMAGMRSLQPKINALKERVGDDKQQMGREMMALYKSEKINPLGGCLPILVQIPFFIALYWVLIATIQLRQAPFMFWIHDLSAKDPYYVLPVLMGLSMFLQQKLSPPPPDPTQAKVMMLLPVFITYIFIHFPAGLILYMLVNNLISIGQQWWITRHYSKGKYNHKKKASQWSAKKKADRKKR